MMIRCQNCDHEFEGEYCPACGQKHIGKFTWDHLISLFFQSIEMEKGLLLNIRDLTIRPGQTIESYLNGKTKNYLNPIAYFLITLAAITLIKSISSNLLYGGLEPSSFASSEDIRVRNIFLMIFFAVGLALSLKIITRYSLLENSIISLFLTSHIFLFYALLSSVPNDVFLILSLAVPTVFAGWIIYKIIGRNVLGSIWRLLTILILTVFFALLGVLALSKARPYIDQEKISDLKAEYDRQQQSNELIEEGTIVLKTRVTDPDVKEFDNYTKEILAQINAQKNDLIYRAGGYDEKGNVIGPRDKNAPYQLFQNMDNSLFEIQDKWLESLNDCDCELLDKNELFDIDHLKNKMMIETMIEFGKIERNILLTEQQCYIKHLKNVELKP